MENFCVKMKQHIPEQPLSQRRNQKVSWKKPIMEMQYSITYGMQQKQF